MEINYQQMSYLPICINIRKKKILIIGGGNSAWHKLKSILKFTTNVVVIAPEIKENIERLPINIIKRNIKFEDIDNFDIIYICTNNRDLNKQLYEYCVNMNKLVNVTDNPGLSTFVSPAVIVEDGMVVAVSSDAKNVKKSIELRDKILKFLRNL